MRDGDADRVFDLSVDHKPESAAEIERIDRHYKALLGQDSWMTREEAEVMEMQEGDSWQPEDYVVESGVDLSVHSAASGGGRRGSNNFSQDGSAGVSVVRVLLRPSVMHSLDFDKKERRLTPSRTPHTRDVSYVYVQKVVARGLKRVSNEDGGFLR